MNKAELIVQKLDLLPHPEGGFYKETYRSDGLITNDNLPETIKEERNYSTGIYFLLTSGNFSAFHKINQDEMWHYYAGDTLHLHILSPDGVYQLILVGKDFDRGEVPQYVVPAGHYFSAEVCPDGEYTLTGCTVSPGFDFRDFTMPSREELSERFPKHLSIVTRLTRA